MNPLTLVDVDILNELRLRNRIFTKAGLAAAGSWRSRERVPTVFGCRSSIRKPLASW